MQETIRVLQNLLKTSVQPVIYQLTDVMADWYKLAQTTFLQTEILHKDIVVASQEVDVLLITLKTAQEKYDHTLNEAIDDFKSNLEAKNVKETSAATLTINRSKSGSDGVDSKQVRKNLRSILMTQNEIWKIMDKNNKLIEQFAQLAVSAAGLECQPDVKPLIKS